MDDTALLSGRPYGGCSIFYRKSLRLQEFSGSSVLLVYVCLPSESAMYTVIVITSNILGAGGFYRVNPGVRKTILFHK